MNVMKGDRARIAFGIRALQVVAAEEDEESGDTAAIARPGRMRRQ
jgi:translation elongation factor EF-1beta